MADPDKTERREPRTSQIAWFVAKASGGGIISYAAPRLLVSAGVPLDEWIVAMGGSLHMTAETALWAATVGIGLLLYLADRLWRYRYRNIHHVDVPEGVKIGDAVDAELIPAASRDLFVKPAPLSSAPKPRFSGQVRAERLIQDVDPSGIRTVGLEIANPTDQDATGLRVRLVEASPPLFESRKKCLGLPLVLTTKARLDRDRNGVEALPKRPFDLAARDKKQIEIFRAPVINPVIGTITGEAGETPFIFQEQEFTVEVVGGGQPFRVVIPVKRKGEGWSALLIIEGTGKAEGKGSVRRREELAAAAQALDDEFHEQEAKTAQRLEALLPSNKLAGVKAGQYRNVSLAEALGWAVYGEWGKPYHVAPIVISIGVATDPRKLLARFTRLASEAKLTIWGKRDDPGYFEKIPQSHWQGNQLTIADVFGSVVASGDDPYPDLMLNRAEVEREWPHEG